MPSGLLDTASHAIGVAISPLVIIVVVLILLSPRAVPNGLAFLGGWLAGLIAVGAVVFAFGGFGGKGGSDSTIEGAVKLAFGVLLLAMACRHWLRNRSGADADGPSWMSAVDNYSLLSAAGSGAFFSAIYPKNLILTAAAASDLATRAPGGGPDIGAYALFIVVGSVTIAGPILLYMIIGRKIDPALARMKSWLTAHDKQIILAILLFFGAKLAIGGIYELTYG
jgi:Sap, sulfolipid-1-addressing protein